MRITLDMVRANKELTRTAEAMGVTLRDLMYDQGRLLAQDATTKVKPGDPSAGPAAQKKAGQEATTGDINKMFFGADNKAALSHWFDRLQTEGREIMTTTVRGKVKLASAKLIQSASMSEMGRLHRQHRDKRGRVRFAGRPEEVAGGKYVVPAAALKKYIASEVKKVGQLKAGFVPAADYFAGLVNTTSRGIPAWVRKQAARMGSKTNAVNRKTGVGYLEAINDVPYVDIAIPRATRSSLESTRQKDIERQAIRRIRAMSRNLNREHARAA